MSKIQGTARGALGSPAPVISLDARREAAAEALARRTLNDLAQEAIVELEAVLAGDIDGVHGAFRAIGRAVSLVLRNRLSA